MWDGFAWGNKELFISHEGWVKDLELVECGDPSQSIPVGQMIEKMLVSMIYQMARD